MSEIDFFYCTPPPAGKITMSFCDEWWPVGSSITCDPPVRDTDFDFLCLSSNREGFLAYAAAEGFQEDIPSEAGSSYLGSNSPFVSMRRGNINLIVTDSPPFAEKFMLATRLARRLNLLRKEDRVALFQAILYGRV